MNKMIKQKHAAKKNYKVFNYKGFDYSRMWMHSSHTNQVGGMMYSITVPKEIYSNNLMRGKGDCRNWTDAQWSVENLFNYFDTAKEMKKAIDTFIEGS
tara:strand:+ start:88 stop:381 length:294 start_codon:yes stop_codon:yes gene_type:complete